MNTNGTPDTIDPAVLTLMAEMAASGVKVDDILAAIGKRPTVGAYVAKVLPTISAGSRRAYGTYVRRFAEDYADHAVASITVTDVVAFTLQVEKRAKASRGDRRNSRDGRSARENAITGLRALFARAVDEGLITDNPASKVPKPARSPEPRRALNQDEIEELCEVTSTGGDDPELDMLIVRFLLESGARREGLLALRLRDVDVERCTVWLREKNNKDGAPPTGVPVDRAHAGGVRCLARGRETRRCGVPLPARARHHGRRSADHTAAGHLVQAVDQGTDVRCAVGRDAARAAPHGDRSDRDHGRLRGGTQIRPPPQPPGDDHDLPGQDHRRHRAAVQNLTGETHPLALQTWNFG